MPPVEKTPRPAYVDDMDDETGRAVRGTRRSAAVAGQKPKISQRERDAHRETRPPKDRRRSRLDQQYPPDEEMNPAQQQVQVVKEKGVERRKSNAGGNKSPRKSDRPPTSHETRNYPQLPQINVSHRPENHTHYGMPTPTSRGAPPLVSQQPIPIRPRAVSTQTAPPRPLSYVQQQQPQGPSYGPPLSMSAYYQQPQMAAPSYPPPSPSSSYMRFHQMPSQGGDYFSPQAISRPLQSRFDPIARTQSAFGSHPPPPSAFDPVPRTTSAFGSRESNSQDLVNYDGGYYDDGYTSASDGTSLRRREPRESIRVPSQRFTQAELDYRAMPPPAARPGILRRPATEYRAPSEYTIDPVDTSGSRRRSREYYDEPVRPRRPSTNRHSVSYDLGTERVTVEAANSGRRRQSFYEQPASETTAASSNYEEKLSKATSYQEDVGGAPVALTAEMLKKQERRQAGSRSSTKSSASRDESDYKKSATTRTTRSGSNDDENVTIKVTGQARVTVGNTNIDCGEGGEIEIRPTKGFNGGRSERSSSDFGGPRFDDRRSRVDRPTVGRSRMSSQSGHSYARPSPRSHWDMESEYI